VDLVRADTERTGLRVASEIARGGRVVAAVAGPALVRSIDVRDSVYVAGTSHDRSIVFVHHGAVAAPAIVELRVRRRGR
jgi:hypothetical protein